MAKKEKKEKKRSSYSDLNETFAPKISEHLLNYLITFFKIDTLRHEEDAIKAIALPISYITSRWLPDGSMMGLVSSNILGRLDEVAGARIKDWDNAKNRVYQHRLKNDGKNAKEVEDVDIKNLSSVEKKIFDKSLQFPPRDKSLAELRTKCGAFGKIIAAKLEKTDLSKISKTGSLSQARNDMANAMKKRMTQIKRNETKRKKVKQQKEQDKKSRPAVKKILNKIW